MRTFTLAEAARLLGTSRSVLYRKIDAGVLHDTSGGGPGTTSMVTAEALRSGSSRQGCASNGVQVPIPSIARFRRLAYPGHGEVTTHERLGWKSHGCHTVQAVSVGAIWVASKPAGLNIKE
jgi:hypothetical protein